MTPNEFPRLAAIFTMAALDPARWQTAVDELADAHPGVLAHLYGQDWSEGAGGRMLGLLSNHAPDFARDASDYAAFNPYPVATAALPVGHVVTNEALVPADRLVRMTYYNEVLRSRQDLIAGAGMVADRGPNRALIIGGQIPLAYKDRLEPGWIRTLQALAPVILNCWQISRRLADGAFDRAVRADVPGGPLGVLVIDPTRRVTYANPEAQVGLARGAPLGVDVRGRLRLPTSLATAVRQAGTGPHVVELADGAQATVARLDPTALPVWQPGLLLGLTAPAILILLSRPTPAADRQAPLRRLGLTGAEAEVALALLDGATPAEIAQKRGVSRHTVRNQVKAVLGKCGVRRQAELVRMLARLTAG